MKTYQKLVSLYQKIPELKFEGSGRVLNLHIESKETLEILKDISSDPNTRVEVIDCDDLKLGQTVQLTISIPLPQTGLIVAKDFPDLIRIHPIYSSTKHYYLYSNKENNLTNKTHSFIVYELFSKLIDITTGDNFILDKKLNNITILGKNLNIKIPINKYTIDKSIYTKLNNGITNLINLKQRASQKYSEEFNAILADEIVSNLKNIPKDNAVNYLLSNLDNIIECTKQSYNIYTSDFSYKKFIDEINKTHIDNYTKIHKVFSDIQAHLIGIPAASFISATQFKEIVKDQSSNLIINIIILLSILVYLLFTYLAVNNQKDTLKNGRELINNEKKKLKLAFTENEVNKIYKSLDCRIKKQNKLLTAMSCSIFIIALIICGVFICYSFT